jgi:hypothetical protein
MSRDTPEAVFEEARAAVARADWTTFFSCLDDADVLSLTKNSGLLGLSKAQELAAQFGISLEDLFPKREALAKAAEAVLDGADSDRLSRSLSVRDLAKQLEAELELKLRAVRDPPGFAGAIETAKRAEMGGGTVSSRMFQDEELPPRRGRWQQGPRRSRDGQRIDPSRGFCEEEWELADQAPRALTTPSAAASIEAEPPADLAGLDLA